MYAVCISHVLSSSCFVFVLYTDETCRICIVLCDSLLFFFCFLNTRAPIAASHPRVAIVQGYYIAILANTDAALDLFPSKENGFAIRYSLQLCMAVAAARTNLIPNNRHRSMIHTEQYSRALSACTCVASSGTYMIIANIM